jgi:hypothetical protein
MRNKPENLARRTTGFFAGVLPDEVRKSPQFHSRTTENLKNPNHDLFPPHIRASGYPLFVDERRLFLDETFGGIEFLPDSGEAGPDDRDLQERRQSVHGGQNDRLQSQGEGQPEIRQGVCGRVRPSV